MAENNSDIEQLTSVTLEAFEEACFRLSCVTEQQIQILNEAIPNANITKKAIVDFIDSTAVINITLSTETLAGTKKSAKPSPEEGELLLCNHYYFSPMFGDLSKNNRKKVALHEISHAFFNDNILNQSSHVNLDVAKETKKDLLPWFAADVIFNLPLFIPLYAGFSMIQSLSARNIRKVEKRADLFSDVFMPDVTYEDFFYETRSDQYEVSNLIPNKKNNTLNILVQNIYDTIKPNHGYSKDLTMPYKDNILGRMTENYHLFTDRVVNFLWARKHPTDLVRIKKSNERCQAILNGETKLKL